MECRIGKGSQVKASGLVHIGPIYRAVLIVLLACSSALQAAPEARQNREVDWRGGGNRRIKGIRFPKEHPTAKESKQRTGSAGLVTKSLGITAAGDQIQIDSPPVAGFVPLITVAVTDEKASDDFDWIARTEHSVTGRFLTDSPESDFVIGLFDTGASTHVMGYEAARRTGVYGADLLTGNETELLGATNSVFAEVTWPLGIFVDGLAAIDPNTAAVDHAQMVGQTNVAILVGEKPAPSQPDLPTVVGSPLSVYFTTAINNDRPITVTYDSNEYTGPDIRFYDHSDPDIPQYTNSIPLNLLPSGSLDVQYIFDYEALISEFLIVPGSPSVILGAASQSLFFVNSVDFYDGGRSSLDKTRFMLDTGAQITVIGSGIASRLGLNPAQPDFEVDIQDVTGETTIHPGFFIDSLEIPVLGNWLSYSNVPVVMLDVASPEGGYLEGIIGMNLFVEFNLVLRGGGLFGQEPPSLEFERITLPPIGDIVPAGGDGAVDYRDLDTLASAWFSTTETANYNERADLWPEQVPDGMVDGRDFAVFGSHWRQTVDPNGSPIE
jgi:aspartyl protease